MQRVKLRNKRKHGGPRPNSGGARSGAGFKKGQFKTETIRLREIRKQALDSGMMPHEFLLMVARGEPVEIFDGKKKLVHYPNFTERLQAAKDACPYFVPKLGNTRITGADEGPVKILNIDPKDLDGLSAEELQVLEKVFNRSKQNGQAEEPKPSVDPGIYGSSVH